MTPTTSSDGPARVHVRAELLTSKKQGAYRHLTLVAPGVPELFRPGGFVAVSMDDTRLARRAYWIHRARPTGGYGATVEIVVAPEGTCGTWLAGLPVGATVELTGPLGRGFALPKEPVDCLLVGEGYAAASLFALAERLRERGCVVSLLLGAADEAHLISAVEARRLVRAVTVVTGDGSVGRRGTVADVIDDELQRTGAAVVYAVGGTETLYAAAAAAERAGAWSQVALETPTVCGTGLCFGCPVPVVGEDGVARTVRGCHDGPVLRGDRIRWADL